MLTDRNTRYCATVHTDERGILSGEFATERERAAWIARCRMSYTVRYVAVHAV